MEIEVAGRAPPPGCLGIVGGMEPRARADLFENIIATTPAQRDQDHMRGRVDRGGLHRASVREPSDAAPGAVHRCNIGPR